MENETPTLARFWLRELRPAVGVKNEDLEPDPDEDELRRYLGDDPLAWALEAADAAAREVIRREPRFGMRPATEALTRRATRSNGIRLLLALARDEQVSLVTADTRLMARHFIANQISAHAVQAGLRLTEIVYTERLLEAAGRLGATGSQVGDVASLVLAIMRIFDAFLSEAEALYGQEIDRAASGDAAVARELVMRVLQGERVDTRTASSTLRYDLDGPHVALVLSGPPQASTPSPSVSVPAGGLQEVSREILRRLGPTACLSIPLGAGEIWMWCSAKVGPDAIASIKRHAHGVRCSVGRSISGVQGFRLSHMQAQEASRFASTHGTDGWVTSWERVALDALLSANGALARQFVADELQGLAQDRSEMRDLRLTLAAYLHHGRGLISSARELQVNRNTVSYRIAKIERLLGYSVNDRMSELQAALRLHALLGGSLAAPEGDLSAPPDSPSPIKALLPSGESPYWMASATRHG